MQHVGDVQGDAVSAMTTGAGAPLTACGSQLWVSPSDLARSRAIILGPQICSDERDGDHPVHPAAALPHTGAVYHHVPMQTVDAGARGVVCCTIAGVESVTAIQGGPITADVMAGIGIVLKHLSAADGVSDWCLDITLVSGSVIFEVPNFRIRRSCA